MLHTWLGARPRSFRLPAARFTSFALCALLAVAPQAAQVASAQGTASDCPNGGTIRFGVEPYEDAALLAPAYQPLSDALGKALNCNVELNITTIYTAEIEAMRSGKLDIAEFGPLAYVFAQKLANAELVATFSDADGNPATYYATIVTWGGSGITDIAQLSGRTFAYSDPAS